MKELVSITGIGSVSPLGLGLDQAIEQYENIHHCIKDKDFDTGKIVCAEISSAAEEEIEKLRKSEPHFESLDRSVLLAIAASRICLQNMDWATKKSLGINIGSSRGATSLFEKYHSQFLDSGVCDTLSSPTTTLGNISSWVSYDLQNEGPVISHSITCSTALHALLNGIAWLKGGMADKFLVGGSEAPLTSFTMAQMHSLRIYSKSKDQYPCKSLDITKKENTLVLGEGASVACIEKGVTSDTLAVIEGIGYATEKPKHSVAISTNALCFQKSMKMALGEIPLEDIDAVVLHAAGTCLGDQAELNAVHEIFKSKIPLITSNKWKIGHTFAASGMLSIEMAIIMLKKNKFINNPLYSNSTSNKNLKKILVNAVGFGGNAVSILLSSPSNV